MPPISSLFPTLPWSYLEVAMNVIAGLGAILLTYGIFLEPERKQDAVFTVGAVCLLTYALWIGNTVFSIAMGGVVVASFIELVEIMRGQRVEK